MAFISSYTEEQYELVRESRQVLFDYCRTISASDFLTENSSFGRGGSIRNLFTHIANSYEFWIAKYGLNKEIVFTRYESIQNIDDVIALFKVIDNAMFEFMALVDNSGKSV